MTTDMLDANELLRAAVAARREAQAAGKPHDEWYGGNAAEMPTAVTEPMPEVAAAEETKRPVWLSDEFYPEYLERLKGSGLIQEQPVEQPGSLPFLELLEELRQLHFFKTAQYGGAADPFENVTASAKCGVEPWRRALCDLSDCVVRMQRFANGQPVDYENALIDAANWSLICLLKLREAKRG
jgi:hypothetical protein